MGLLGKKRYRDCKSNPDGTVECIMYVPTKDNKKIVTARILAQKTPDCKAQIIEDSGDVGDVEDLQNYLEKKTGLNCSRSSTI